VANIEFINTEVTSGDQSKILNVISIFSEISIMDFSKYDEDIDYCFCTILYY